MKTFRYLEVLHQGRINNRLGKENTKLAETSAECFSIFARVCAINDIWEQRLPPAATELLCVTEHGAEQQRAPLLAVLGVLLQPL